MLKFFNKQQHLPGAIGNVIEWYDFSLYSYFAPLIAKLFFPEKYGFKALVITWLVFAVSFIMRPLGGIIFGFFGDRIDTNLALFWSITLVAFSTVLIGILPTYHTIGYYAPIVLIILRLLQGISAGGQYTGSLVYFAENSNHNRAQAACLAYWGSLAGYGLASLIGWLTFTLLPYKYHLTTWRLPYLLSASFIILLVWGKSYFIKEQQQFTKVTQQKTPLMKLITQYPRYTAKLIGLASFGGFLYYTNFAFLLTYYNYYLKLNFRTIFEINSICLMSTAITTLFFAELSDRFGRRPLLIAGTLGLAVVAFPSFALMQHATFLSCLLGGWLLTLCNSCFIAAAQPIYAEMFPANVRYTGCSLSFNIGTGIVGGLTPMILAMIAEHAHWYSLAATALAVPLLCCIYVLLLLPESYRFVLD